MIGLITGKKKIAQDEQKKKVFFVKVLDKGNLERFITKAQ